MICLNKLLAAAVAATLLCLGGVLGTPEEKRYPVENPSKRVGNVDPTLFEATETQEVMIKLKTPAVAEISPEGGRMSHKERIHQEQSAFLERNDMGSNEISRVQTLLNAVFLSVDASEIKRLARDPDVVSIKRVGTYELHLDETVPYIGATIVQNQGNTGSGIKVAVLDGGIDYTHAAFGGRGTRDAFKDAYDDSTKREGLFPTAKVVDGFDFVGELWPDGPIEPDEDPIDGQGHGTAVADIINSVAPGVSLYAVRVCGRFTSTCSGSALMQGLEWAVEQEVDIVNLSIGTAYGTPFDHDLSQAINAATDLGVLVVASAGNNGDKPYIVATGGSARGALSVAETQVPSASLQVLTAGGVDYNAVLFPWAPPLETVISAPIQYGDGRGGNLDGCNDFDRESLAGKVVLVDRGDCNFSLKVSKVTEAGGLACIIGRVDAGDAFPGGDGGDRPIGVPAYMIDQDDADVIRASWATMRAELGPENQRPLVKTMAGSSSRGPQHEFTTLIKPEIGAPGAMVAALAGSGSKTEPFGGTSGAAPVVAGSAALILERYPNLEPHEVKARLMNNGEINIRTNPFKDLAPITRIGGGEVRVDKAIAARVAAWDVDTKQGALSFGFIDVYRETQVLYKRIQLRNYSNENVSLTIRPTFRYPEQDFGAVTIRSFYPSINVGAQQDVILPIILTIKGNLLTGNYMNSGEEGGSGDALTRNEYDGYIELDDGVQQLHVPWHILPRKAANVSARQTDAGWSLFNDGVGEAQIEAFSLLALSEDIPSGGPGEGLPTPDIRAVGIRTRRESSGECSDANSFIWDFAVSTWERQENLAATLFKIFLDLDGDGESEYLVSNNDISGRPVAVDGRQVVYVLDLNSLDHKTGFFVDHSMNTGNIVLSVCSDDIGLSANDFSKTTIGIAVHTQDIIYTGSGDSVNDIFITPGAERFVALTEDIEPGQTKTVTVTDAGSLPDNSEEFGVMIITDGDRGPGSRGGATQESEVLLLEI